MGFRMLMNREGAQGGGGGAGGGQGNGAQGGQANGAGQGAGGDAGGQGAGGANADELAQLVGRQVAGAVNNYFRRGSVKEQIAAAVGEVLPGVLSETLTQLGVTPGGAGGAQQGGGASTGTRAAAQTGGDSSIDDHPTIKQLKAQNEQLQKQLKAQQDAVETERSKAQQQEERSALVEALREAGVPDSRIRGAVAELYLDQRRVVRTEQGQIGFTVQREWGPEVIPLGKGITEWLGTEEGKVYLPPVQTQGSGGTGGMRPRPPGQKPTRGELMNTLGRLMLGGGMPGHGGGR